MSVDLEPEFQRTPEGTVFRDLNGNGVMDPYENPGLPVAERVEDLLGRLSLEEKVGLMFQTVVSAAENGKLGYETPGQARPLFSKSSPTSTSITSISTSCPSQNSQPVG